jgi:hypothetical protein
VRGASTGQVAPSGAALIEPPPTASFWSVRSYPDAAEPVRLRIPAAVVDTRLQRPGRAGPSWCTARRWSPSFGW